jgi:DNA-binding MarR family transcriptional regulator
MKKTSRAEALELSWDEIGFICQGLVFASRGFRVATRRITEEYSLGPRGAWITMLISLGQVVFPLDLTKMFQIGRSLITAELTRLSDAGLIDYRRCASDGRRVELVLTPLGQTVQRQVKEELAKLVTRRLASYTREQALLCARMLHDFNSAAPESVKLEQTRGRSRPSAVSKRRAAR